MKLPSLLTKPGKTKTLGENEEGTPSPLPPSSSLSYTYPTAIVTMPPYATFMEEVVRHPIVSGIRLNTVMPVVDSLDDVLKRMYDIADGKDFWVDLKGRQLRTVEGGTPPFTKLRVSHNLRVQTPVRAYFSDGQETARILAVKGDTLIMEDGPRRPIGPGESVNIPDHSLRIDGYLTDTDKQYIESATRLGIHRFMLSYVEGQNDIDRFFAYDKDADLVAKIETKRGLGYVRDRMPSDAPFHLMAARGDLYVELDMPHEMPSACRLILAADPDAIVASRIFPSLAGQYTPSAADVGDVDGLIAMGYRRFMLGDEVCQHRDSVMSALNLFEAMATGKSPYKAS